MEESKGQNKIIFAVIGVAILLTLTIGLSFAIYSYNATGSVNTITTGTISMSFIESTNVIDLTNALPVQNVTAAKSGDYFQFTVKSTSTDAMNISYTIKASEVALDSGYTTLGQSNVHLYLTQVNSGTEVAAPLVNTTANNILGGSTTGTLYTGTHNHLAAGEMSTVYRLRMWIPYSVNASSWTSSTKLQYKIRIDVSSTI